MSSMNGQVIAAAAHGLEAVAITGIGIAFDAGQFRVVALDVRGQAVLSLGPYREDEVIAEWRAMSAASGLPMTVPGFEGAATAEAAQPPRRPVRADTRRLAVLRGRRPRFLVRRKASRLPRRPIILRGAELAAGSAG